MMRGARKELGLATSQTVMIGDTMDTDILGGVQMGYQTILVLTGTTSREAVDSFSYHPDLILDSIDEINQFDTGLDAVLPFGDKMDDTVVLEAI
jgi:NagD protein